MKPFPKKFNTRMLIGKQVAVITKSGVYLGKMLEHFESTNSIVLEDYKLVKNGKPERSGKIAVINEWMAIEHA